MYAVIPLYLSVLLWRYFGVCCAQFYMCSGTCAADVRRILILIPRLVTDAHTQTHTDAHIVTHRHTHTHTHTYTHIQQAVSCTNRRLRRVAKLGRTASWRKLQSIPGSYVVIQCYVCNRYITLCLRPQHWVSKHDIL
jgi:hypothetical protein